MCHATQLRNAIGRVMSSVGNLGCINCWERPDDRCAVVRDSVFAWLIYNRTLARMWCVEKSTCCDDEEFWEDELYANFAEYSSDMNADLLSDYPVWAASTGFDSGQL
eukprot:2248329-Rhodomonas_salina.1